MIIVNALNRRVRVDRKKGEPIVDSPMCSAVLAIDPSGDPASENGFKPTRVKCSFLLTDEEADEFDALAYRIQLRLANDLANQSLPAAIPTDTEQVPDPERTAQAIGDVIDRSENVASATTGV